MSCEEIDFLQVALLNLPGILGARMMGGGFGGCLLVLAQDNLDFTSIETLAFSYKEQYGFSPRIERIDLVDGVQVLFGIYNCVK